MAAPATFSNRAVLILLAVGGVSFFSMLALVVFGDLIFTARSVGANSFSESAIGHKALKIGRAHV